MSGMFAWGNAEVEAFINIRYATHSGRVNHSSNFLTQQNDFYIL